MVESARWETKLDAARNTIDSRASLQTRLQSLFTSITPGEFYTKKEDLFFGFDNEVDPDPAFSGAISAKVHLDEKNHLVLTTWPANNEKTSRKEILLHNVDHVEFEFLGKKGTEKEKMRPINAQYAWRFTWAKTDLATPSSIRLLVWEKNQPDPVRFAFLLPTSEPFITYRGIL
jgi:hypothetical protein